MSSKIGLLYGSIGTIVPLMLNPLAWVGAVGGALIGWGLCWLVFVLPFQKNLADREAQLDHWSQLNQQLQQQTMDNRSMSQSELNPMRQRCGNVMQKIRAARKILSFFAPKAPGA